MVRCAAKLCLLSALAVSLLACSSDKKQAEENPNVFPSDYKNEILTTLTSSLDDPTNIRSAYITDPFIRPAGKEERYVVCVRSDSRNVARHYTGIRIASVISITVISINWLMLRKNSAEISPTSRFPNSRNYARPRNAIRRPSRSSVGSFGRNGFGLRGCKFRDQWSVAPLFVRDLGSDFLHLYETHRRHRIRFGNSNCVGTFQ